MGIRLGQGRLRERLLLMSGRKTQIMAIINVTPDSFSDGGVHNNVESALCAAETAIRSGADILDVGGESTRPGAGEVPTSEELQRVLPVIQALKSSFPDVPISIDTRKSVVAHAAVQAGASIINDVSGLQSDPKLAAITAAAHARLVIMHSQGTPEVMQKNPHYPNGLIQEIQLFFERQIALAVQAGVARERIILDPGFGFGKTLDHNLELLHNLHRFLDFNLPILVGTSRKSFLTLGQPHFPPNQREALTAASLALAIQGGATMIRIHDTEIQTPVIRFVDASLSTA
jgi:dihydropteroate synthase